MEQKMFVFWAVFTCIITYCDVVFSAERSEYENARSIPTFSPIEPDLSVRTFSGTRTQTAANANGTKENQRSTIHPHTDDPLQVLPNVKSKSHETADGREVRIFDDVLDFKLMSALQEYSHLIPEWEFQSNGDVCHGPSPWAAPLDPKPFEDSAFVSLIKELVATMTGEDVATSLEPFSFSLHVFRRGDPISLLRDSEGEARELSLLVYFNHYWRKNDYGEMLFYDSEGEPFAIVSPKYNRMVLWDSSLNYVMKPPSMDFKQGMICLKVRLTSNATWRGEARQQWLDNAQEKARARETLFTDMQGSEVKTIQDVEECLTANYTTSQGKRVYVFDGLFNSNDLMKLRDFVPRHGKFYFDDSLDLDSDNVQWIAAFSLDSYTQGPMWPVTQKVAAFVSGMDQWFPYDISCNLLRTYDHTRIHEDCEVGEKEWTFLVYLTHEWSEERYGETTYLHANSHDSEHLISVLPRFGRVVIFEGIIPHSARPPSPSFKDARLTFVAKLSINEWIGRVKSLKTEFGHEESMHQSFLDLVKNYHDKMYKERYMEMLLENAQELKEVNSALNRRFKHSENDVSYAGRQSDMEADDEDEEEEEDEEEDEDHHHHHHLVFEEEDEGKQYDEQSHFDGEMYPEVQRRRQYIYGLLRDPQCDLDTLRAHYRQATEDRDRVTARYVKQMEKLI